ncbi:MAG: DivIVA domain-containing protein [Bacillales bacterium]|nr:DivIVA domain-containing protein [Bacillales bacterium]
MEKFNRVLRGYDPDEVNNFLDHVIAEVEKMVSEIKAKDEEIVSLKAELVKQDSLKSKLANYERLEDTMNKAIFMAQKTSEQMKVNAHNEAQLIMDDAKKNASRIVNEALLRAEKTEMEANMLRRNINVFKRRIKAIIEEQLESVEEIDKVEF